MTMRLGGWQRAFAAIGSLVILAVGSCIVAYQLVFAAALTNTNVQPASLDAGVASTVTVTFTTTAAIPANGKVKVIFPNGFDVAGVNGVSCSPSIDGNFTFSVEGQLVTIIRNSGTQSDGGAKTCTINNVKNPTVAGSTGNYQIETRDGADSLLDADANVAGDNILAALMPAADVQPASLAANAVGNVSVTFTTINSLEANGKVVVQFPGGFNVAGANNPTCSSMDGSFSVGVNGQQVTITRGGGTPEPAGPQTCAIGNIGNPAGAGVTGTYQIQTQTATNQLHDIAPNIAGDTITGGGGASLSSTNVQPASLSAGASSTVTVTFTTSSAVPANGKIRVTFPNGFNLSGASGGTCSTMNGTFVTNFFGQQVLLTRQNDGGVENTGAESCTINNIINPDIAAMTGNYQIETMDAANSIINVDSAVPGDNVTAGALTSTNVQPASLVANAVGTVTVSFTTTNAIASDGKVRVTFPTGFNVAQINGVSCGPSMDGNFTFGVNGQQVTINRNGGTKTSPGAKTCTINNVTNPSGAGVTGTYTIETLNNATQVHDRDSNVPGDTITAASVQALTGTNVQPGSLVAGSVSAVTVTFTTATSIPNNGKVKVTFPTGFNVAQINGVSCSSSMDGSFTFGVNGQQVTINRNGGSPAGVGAKTCTINSVNNPSIAGTTGTYSIQTTDNANTVLDQDLAVLGDAISAGVLTSTNVEPVSLLAGETTNVTVTFTTMNGIESDGKIKVTFPAGFDVSQVSGVGCGPSMDGSFTFGVNGQDVTINRNGGTKTPAGPKSCTINSIVNPSVGQTGSYGIVTTDNVNAVHDQDLAVTGDIIVGTMTGVDVEPSSLTVNATSTVVVTFTSLNTVPDDGKVVIVFPSGFNVTGATSGTCGSMDGAFATNVFEQTVTLLRSGGSNAAPGSHTCTILGIQNPSAVGPAGTYEVGTLNASNTLLDRQSAVDQDSFTAASSSAASGQSTLTYFITLTAPTGSQQLTAGTSTPIQWTADGTGTIAAVNLSYSTDGGTFWTTMVAGTANDGQYDWELPSEGADAVIVKAEATDLVVILATDTTESFGILGVQTDGEEEGGQEEAEVGSEVDPEEPTGTDEALEIITDIVVTPGAEVTIVPGMLISGTTANTVYYVDENMSLRPFPDSQTFFTYADSFDSVVRLADEKLAPYSIGSAMVPKAGSVLVKMRTDHAVYAIEYASGSFMLRWIASELLAETIFGTLWSDHVLDIVSDAWGSFSRGGDVTSPDDLPVTTDGMRTRNELNSK